MGSWNTVLAGVLLLSVGCSFDPSASGGPDEGGGGGGGGGGGAADDPDGDGVIGGESEADAGAAGSPDATPGAPARVLTASGSAVTVGNLGGNGGSDFLADCGPNYLVTGLDAEDNDFGLCRLRATCGEIQIDGGSIRVVSATQTPQFGDETSYYDINPVSCPAGAVVVGYVGSESDQGLVHSIRPFCSDVEWDGSGVSFSNPYPLQTTLGSPSQDGVGTAACPEGQVAAGIAGRAGSIIDRFQLRCYQPVANEI